MPILRRPLAWTLAAALATVACDDVLGLLGGEDPGVTLRTDRTEYTSRYVRGEEPYRQYGFVLVARFENRGQQPVYLARCYPDSPHPTFGVELLGRDSGDSRGSGYNGFWACVGHSQQILVPAGGSRTDTLHLIGPNAWDGATKQAFGTLAGQMRLTYGVQTCLGDGACELGREAGRSNVFTVKHQP